MQKPFIADHKYTREIICLAGHILSIMYTEKIAILTRFLQRHHVVVVTDLHLPSDISGRTYYAQRRIALNEWSAKTAFETLTHEAGHWLVYEALGWLPSWIVRRSIRELLADWIGTLLLYRMDYVR